ncbi:MAG: hypothetical protein LBI06_03150, partial [Treponema sp.]|nr:hypothetical protein [Treponema sp.]
MVQIVLQTDPIFSDNMVLQHGKPVPVWGSGGEGSTVCVSWECGGSAVSASTKVYRLEWSLKLPPLPAGLCGELILSDGQDEIRFCNVITGDVWFAGGQSNM